MQHNALTQLDPLLAYRQPDNAPALGVLYGEHNDPLWHMIVTTFGASAVYYRSDLDASAMYAVTALQLYREGKTTEAAIVIKSVAETVDPQVIEDAKTYANELEQVRKELTK